MKRPPGGRRGLPVEWCLTPEGRCACLTGSFGAGAALYQHALAFLRSEGRRVAFVAAGADDRHAPALRAYDKVGFQVGIPSRTPYRAL